MDVFCLKFIIYCKTMQEKNSYMMRELDNSGFEHLFKQAMALFNLCNLQNAAFILGDQKIFSNSQFPGYLCKTLMTQQ